jgi:hypothetical protein
MTQEGRQRKHLWWDACGLRLAAAALAAGAALYLWWA